MKNPEPRSGYVRCTCCDLPIAVTSDDVGLAVTCPRTRKLFPVKEADLTGGPPPAVKPAAVAPRPVPPRPAEPRDSAPLQPDRSGPGALAVALLGVSVLLVIAALGGAIWKMSRPAPELAREVVVQPEPPPPPVTPPVAPLAPLPKPLGGDAVAPPVVPPVRPPVAPVPPPAVPVAAPDPRPAAPPAAPVAKADPNVALAAGAVSGLALLASAEAALDGCVGACGDPDATVRRRAATGLALFLTSPDENVRRKAAAALAGLGGDAEPALAALKELVNDTDADVRKSARAAVEKIDEAATFAKAGKTQKELLILAKELQAKEPAKRIKALEQIAAYGADANIIGEQLIAAMADPVPAVQVAASEALEKANPKVQPHVFTLLHGMDKAGAVRELEKLGSDAVITVPMFLHFIGAQPAPGIGKRPRAHNWGDLYSTVVKIAPKDKRVVALVLSTVAAPIPDEERRIDPGLGFGVGLSRRYSALRQLGNVEADKVHKVKALTAALADGEGDISVMEALADYGKDAEPALPLLKKLKFSSNDAIRNAAIKAIAKIE